MKLLNEGGNAIKSASPIRGDIAGDIANKIVKLVKDKLGCQACALGSTGKKTKSQHSGDIDIAVQLSYTEENVKKLRQFVIDEFGNDVEMSLSPGFKLLSIGYKYKEDPKDDEEKVAQIDFMFTIDLNYAVFIYHSPDFRKNESAFKGLYRTNLLIIVAGKTPIDRSVYQDEFFLDDDYEGQYTGVLKSFWKYTLNYDEGLKIVHKSFEGKTKPLKNPYTVKEDTSIITNDYKKVLGIILGDGATTKDTNSFEDLVDFLCSPKYKYRSETQLNKIFDEFFNDTRHTKDPYVLDQLEMVVKEKMEKYGII